MRSIVFVFFIFLMFTDFAQNNLHLSSSNGNVFKVLIKGKASDDKLQAHVLLQNRMEDTLYLELEFENKKKFPVTIYFLEQGVPCKSKEFNYSIDCDLVTLHARFTGMYEINKIPNAVVPIKPRVDTSQKYRNARFDHFCELKEGKPIFFNNLPKEGCCHSAMSKEYLGHASFLISKAEGAERKFTIVENTIRNNCISVEQLNTLLGDIEYEIEKLKLVRLGYYNLVDTVNKKNLTKSFRFEASVNELNAFLNEAAKTKQQNVGKCTSAASEMILTRFAEKLATYETDTERFDAFKRGYADLCYTADQSATIMNKFIHDREKLEAAKLMYFNCVEKDKFMKVTQVFSYNESGNELKDFIEKQRD